MNKIYMCMYNHEWIGFNWDCDDATFIFYAELLNLQLV